MTSCFSRHSLLSVTLLLLVSVLFMACNQEGRGFALPEGDAELGKAVFVEMNCNACHSTSDIDWLDEGEDLHLPLGGEVSVSKSYGELVTSIINPKHKISPAYKARAAEKGKTVMNNYNDLLTVQEVVDLVTYLQDEYAIVTPPAYYSPF